MCVPSLGIGKIWRDFALCYKRILGEKKKKKENNTPMVRS
jgi:hypothetical protein